MNTTLMDFSIRRIDSSLVRGVGPKRRKRDDEHAEFDLDLGDTPAPPSPPTASERSDEAPVAAPDTDEAGGRLDVTA